VNIKPTKKQIILTALSILLFVPVAVLANQQPEQNTNTEYTPVITQEVDGKEKESEEPEHTQPVENTPAATPEQPAQPEEPKEEVKPEPEINLKDYAKTSVLSIKGGTHNSLENWHCFDTLMEYAYQWKLDKSQLDGILSLMHETKEPCGHLFVWRNTGQYTEPMTAENRIVRQ